MLYVALVPITVSPPLFSGVLSYHPVPQTTMKVWYSLLVYSLLMVFTETIATDCDPRQQQHWVVNSTSRVNSLAEASNNCTNGVFSATWIGHVVVENTIVVGGNTTLSIMGVDVSAAGAPGATVDGGGSTRPFFVSAGGGLYLTDLTITNGNGTASGGGAVYSYYGNLTLDGTTSFVNNSAEYGGAIASLYGNLALDGNTSFVGNTADGIYIDHVEDGGPTDLFSFRRSVVAIHEDVDVLSWEVAGGGAIFSWESTIASVGTTSFVANSAVELGGAIFSRESTIASDGTTSFVNNAGEDGGGISSVNDTIALDGMTLFVDNFAEGGFGGAVLSHGGAIAVNGTTSFADNSAGHYNSFARGGGGAVTFIYGNLTLDGKTSFVNNFAEVDGGAIYSEQGTIALNGNTSFVNNSANRDRGGAIVSDGDTIALKGTTSFVNNSVDLVGGAISSYSSTIAFHEKTSFQRNTASDGGAIHSDRSWMTFPAGGHTTFTNNSAGVYGGGISYFNTFEEDHLFVGIVFDSNSAAVGGALSLSGKTVLVDVRFERNNATLLSPAIHNMGTLDSITNVSFDNNVFHCDDGEFLEEAQGNETERYEVVCGGCTPDLWENCDGCSMGSSGTVPTCTKALDNTGAEAGSTIETISIHQGYWRATNISRIVRECYNFHACRGGQTGSSTFCEDGYEGAYCSVCAKGYSRSIGFACTKCTSRNRNVTIALGAALIVLVAALFGDFVVSLVRDTEAKLLGCLCGGRAVCRGIPFQAIKIIVVVWQILTQFSSVASVTYPEIYEQFLSYVNIVANFDVSLIFSTGCVWPDFNFHGTVLFNTLTPLAVAALLGITYVIAKRSVVAGGRGGKLRKAYVSAFLWLSVFVYSTDFFFRVSHVCVRDAGGRENVPRRRLQHSLYGR